MKVTVTCEKCGAVMLAIDGPVAALFSDHWLLEQMSVPKCPDCNLARQK